MFNFLALPQPPLVLYAPAKPGAEVTKSSDGSDAASSVEACHIIRSTVHLTPDFSSDSLDGTVDAMISFLNNLESQGILDSCTPVVLYSVDDGTVDRVIAVLQNPRLAEEVLCLTSLNVLPAEALSTFVREYGFLLCCEFGKTLPNEPTPPTLFVPSRIHTVDRQLFLAGVAAAHDLQALQHLGISRVVNATSDEDDAFTDNPSFTYFRAPMDDVPEQNLSPHIAKALPFIEEGLRMGVGTLVHCTAGVSRSASLVVALIMRNRGLGYDDALALVRECRWCVRPNEGFVRQLRELEAVLISSSSGSS
jgi:dual specificity MAP kinase phosphatase